MKRREFFERAGIGSAALVTLPGFAPATSPNGTAARQEHDHGGKHDEMEGPLASADVSFGQWDLDDSPLDRFPNNSPRTRNFHHLTPDVVEIKAGGSVNFHIAGFHHVLIYDDGTQPKDINTTLTRPPTTQPAPPLIDDPVRRLYRGLDPSVLPLLPGSTPPQPLQDRVETVRFSNPGKFLVMCGVLPHFVDPVTGQFIMFGYVKVRR
ncbi:MAG: hypothetical protein JWL71_2355 [Acidobacteria bacterium]|nr:hypothetical protein [Acidobacteriota bacterium]